MRALALALVAGTVVVTAQAPISIGLVREDGYLIPIATVTPALFAPPFPFETNANGEPLPPEKREWPFKTLQWRLSSPGKAPVEITTLEPLILDSHCTEQSVWRTTLKLFPAQKNVAPVGKIGAAISGGTLEHPEDVSGQPDAASRRVASRIVQLTHAKEAERVASEPAQYLPPNHSPAERAKVAVRVAQLRRHSAAGLATYYFEATKAWGAALDNGLVTGWIVDTPSGLKDHDVKYKFNDDRFKENARAIVWGIVRSSGRSLWILEWHGYESESYTLHEWPSGVERVVVDGGAC